MIKKCINKSVPAREKKRGYRIKKKCFKCKEPFFAKTTTQTYCDRCK